MAKSTLTLPSLYAVTGTIQPSNFAFYQASSENIENLFSEAGSLKDIRKHVTLVQLQKNQGYLGTISNFIKTEDFDKVLEGDSKSPRNPNLGARDVAALDFDKDTLVVEGTIKFVPNFYKPSISNKAEFTAVHVEFVQRFIEKYGIATLLEMYVDNIYSARILWRNQHGVNRQVFVRSISATGSKVHADKASVVAELARAMENKEVIILEVAISVMLGEGAEVYPSQPFTDNKESLRGQNYGRILSTLLQGGKEVVILHSQKVGNALRTIDTWYAEGAEEPIAIEAYGAVPMQNEVHRTMSSKQSFFNYFDYKLVNHVENQEIAFYVMAMLIKGGVFGFSSEKPAKSTDKE